MATFRKVHTSFWSDPFTQELTPEQKYFYLYLITNEKTRQCGIYEVTKRQMCYDTGYNIDTVSKLLEYFISSEKIKYNPATNELAVKNWAKYNSSTSPKVQSCINQELKLVKDKGLIQYLYSMDTHPQEEEEEEEEKKKKKIEKLPEMTGKEFSDYKRQLLSDGIFIEPLMMNRGVKNLQELENWVTRYHLHISGEGKINKDYSEYKKHFKNWIFKQDTFNSPAAKPEKKMVI